MIWVWYYTNRIIDLVVRFLRINKGKIAVNAIKIVLFVIIVSFSSGFNFLSFSMEDDSEDVFYDNKWDEFLVHLSDKKDWDQRTNKPRQAWLSEAVECAFDAIKNDGRTEESIKNEFLATLNSLFVSKNEYGKEEISKKDLRTIYEIKNDFENALNNKIQEKSRSKEIKIQEKKALKGKKEKDFDMLLKEVARDWWGVPTKEWRDAVVDQALDQIQLNNNTEKIVEKISNAVDNYKQSLWSPFYKSSVDQVKEIIISAIQNEVTEQKRKKEEAEQREISRIEKIQQEQRDKFKSSMIDVHSELKTRYSEKEKEKQKKEQEQKQVQELEQKRMEEERALSIQKQQEQYKNVMHQQLKSIHEKKEQAQKEMRRERMKNILEIERSAQDDINKLLMESKEYREGVAKQEQERQQLQQEKIHENRKKIQKKPIKRILEERKKQRERQLSQKAQILEVSFLLQEYAQEQYKNLLTRE